MEAENPGRGPFYPSRSHAGQVLQTIREAAKDVPVNLKNSMPEINRMGELLDAGGKGTKPLTTLAKRATRYLTPSTKGTAQEPILFPEGRDIYSNVSDASRQSPLQTIMGTGLKPTMLRQAGRVKGALSSDLTDAASQVGMGEDHANALKEYARASQIRKGLIGAGMVGAGEVARRTGIFGKTAKAVTLGQ